MQTDTAAIIANDLLAECGRQAAIDFLIDRLIDCDDDEDADAIESLITAVERAAAH